MIPSWASDAIFTARKRSLGQGNIYRSQRSCGQGYVFTRVCDSVNGGGVVCLSACWIPTPPRSRHPPGSRLRDTVNERLVRILLECILVSQVSVCPQGGVSQHAMARGCTLGRHPLDRHPLHPSRQTPSPWADSPHFRDDH